MNKCKDCKFYTDGVPEVIQKAIERRYETWRQYDGICHKYFPRGYLGRKPPHAVRAAGGCFQFEPRSEIDGQEAIE